MLPKKISINVFWFRRDLRLEDNHGLYKALQGQYPVLPIFIFDKQILEGLPKNDARVNFIYETLQNINQTLKEKHHSSITFFHDKPIDAFKKLLKNHTVKTVYTNHDYEPYARERDKTIRLFLESKNVAFKTYKDHVIFEKSEITKKDGKPYLVYTPYMKTWKKSFQNTILEHYKSSDLLGNMLQYTAQPSLSINTIGFEASSQKIAPYSLTSEVIQSYKETRDFPALDTTTKLGSHLRFGTISIKHVIQQAVNDKNETFWQELIWREFFMQILWHFPHTATQSFKPKYDRIEWRNNEAEFKLWCEGKTGYPLVDAGMRQLNQTGFMHNRVRMVVGSFLCKNLLIDWRWGEAYFAEKLHDYEMSSNIGNWQWVAGCGVDAAPYFRIFNPTTQIKKFDKNLEYIKTWVPEFQELSYPKPIVDHKEARERCLKAYKTALN